MNPLFPADFSRRRFLAGSGTASLAPVLFPYVLGGSAVAKDSSNQDTLKVGLVGCGGRGTGAASQALSADYNTRLFAVADLGSRARRELRLPLVAIGGITPENGGLLIAAGADMLAVVNGLFAAANVRAAAQAFTDLFPQET